jgi:hypothetical protein
LFSWVIIDFSIGLNYKSFKIEINPNRAIVAITIYIGGIIGECLKELVVWKTRTVLSGKSL